MLEKFKMSAADAEDLIMRARLAAGWVTEEDLKKAEAPAEEAVAGEPA
jgi:N utilization substance protein A